VVFNAGDWNSAINTELRPLAQWVKRGSDASSTVTLPRVESVGTSSEKTGLEEEKTELEGEKSNVEEVKLS
jgi:hypothetical protein